jgi:hypothetical protein
MVFFSFLIFFQIKIDDKHPKLDIGFIGDIKKSSVFANYQQSGNISSKKTIFFPCCFGELLFLKNQAYVLQILKYVTKYSSCLFIYIYIYIATPKKHWMHAWIDPHPDFRVLESREAGWIDG